jgi:CDP-diacylglycerol--glycerol-3-phosphate 3-phosphatidyltransferase
MLGHVGLTPNALTVLGYLLHVPATYLLATGHLRLGGVLVALAALIDSLDGVLARETGRDSKFGAFLDSVIDRLSEGTVLFGLCLWYLATPGRLEVVLEYIALLGSVMVSYTRARAEALGFECEVGFLTRVERIVLLAVGLVFLQVRWMLWAMAILTNATALQRVFHVWRLSRQGDDALGPQSQQ